MKESLFNALEKLRRLRAGLPIDPTPDEVVQATGTTTVTTTAITDWTQLPGDWLVWFEERAAIMEFDGGLPRERAEVLALKEVLEAMGRQVRR